MTHIFLSFFFFLIIPWILYPVWIILISFLRKESVAFYENYNPKISIIIAAFNEEKNILTRIKNILQSNYPTKKIEIIIASDGSTDSTNNIVKDLSIKNNNIKLVEISPQQGRANAHNEAVKVSSGDIFFFTDADTEFEIDFIEKIVYSFADDSVGFSSGRLLFKNVNEDSVSGSVGLYWKFEMWLRKKESKAGLLIVGSGACSAVRRELFKPIMLAGDEDFITPLDTILQGYKCVHVNDAIAYDYMPGSPSREFRSRVRMTSRNLYGTMVHWRPINFLKHPVYTLVLFCHKILRWLTPFTMILLFIANLILVKENLFFVIALILQIVFYLIALIGLFNKEIPIVKQVYSFCLANIGFLVGVFYAIIGKVPRKYIPVNKL